MRKKYAYTYKFCGIRARIYTSYVIFILISLILYFQNSVTNLKKHLLSGVHYQKRTVFLKNL